MRYHLIDSELIGWVTSEVTCTSSALRLSQRKKKNIFFVILCFFDKNLIIRNPRLSG